MKKGNETEVVITMQMPGQDAPMHIPGLLIMEGMTVQEIERCFRGVISLIVEQLVATGKMRYFPKEEGKIESLANLLPDLPKNPPRIEDEF